jgi:hypothetical protein
MSIETNVKSIELDSESLFKTQKIKVNSSKSFQTPSKAINLQNVRQKYNLDTKLREVNEIFKRVDSKTLNNYHSDPEFEQEINKKIIFEQNKIDLDKNSRFCFLEFDEPKYPESDEIETLTSISHSFSDITPIPILSFLNKKKISENEFKDYIDFTSSCIESIEQINNKSIMGVIPFLPTKFIPHLIKFYVDAGINSFCVDLDGSNPIPFLPRIRKLLISIKNNKPLEECYIHGFNVGIGRPNKIAEVVPAKDILGLGTGFGTIGDKHKKFKPNREFIEYLKTNPEHKFRLFNKADYGYWRGISYKQIKNILPKDCNIDPDLFGTYKNKLFLQKLFNSEQLSIEAINLRNVINESPEKSLDYIKTKKHVLVDDFEKLKNISKKI